MKKVKNKVWNNSNTFGFKAKSHSQHDLQVEIMSKKYFPLRNGIIISRPSTESLNPENCEILTWP